jgi:hypothetical protein
VWANQVVRIAMAAVAAVRSVRRWSAPSRGRKALGWTAAANRVSHLLDGDDVVVQAVQDQQRAAQCRKAAVQVVAVQVGDEVGVQREAALPPRSRGGARPRR